ncbi:MAG: glutathione S-transferase family protein [Beijerinckiaceae bacterium]
MLTLYHADTAVCAAKVRVTLAEKQLAYEGKIINLHAGDQFKPEYMQLNPNAVVPTLVHDGNVLIESGVINEYLDEAFAEKPLRPADPLDRARMRLWTKREDTVHDAINTMTAVIVFRHELMQKPPEERAKRYEKIPNLAKRAKWARMMEEGIDSGLVRDALQVFAKQFRDMEAALANGPWLLGDNFTLADGGLISFFYRLEMLRCAGLWRDHFPRVTDWFERCKARPSFKTAILDMVPEGAHEKYKAIADPLWPKVDAVWRDVLA